MKIEKVNINDLISPDYNPREISDEEMQKLKTSIQEFGYIDPIIVNDVNQHIVGGNQRYFALQELGYTEVDVVYIHEEDSNREKALNIALNKISGEFDEVKLNQIFTDMKLEGFEAISLTGFEEHEILELSLIDDLKYDEGISEENYIDIPSEEETSKETLICPYCDKEITL